ncbi:MAG: hypothetical protein WCC87_00505 [Candidatus Korobacteraceae bacterium]
MDVPTAVDDMQDQDNAVWGDTMNDDILSGGKTAEAGPPIPIASAPNKGVLCQQPKKLGDVIDNPVGNVYAAAFPCYAQPNTVKLFFHLR